MNRTRTIRQRVTPNEEAFYKSQARDAGQTLSEWIRSRLGTPPDFFIGEVEEDPILRAIARRQGF